jgi:nucleotide-binding universal stress UspA family protein
VVRGRWRPVRAHEPAPVVVGADGSAGSRAALEFAIAEAALRHVPLVAVCALCDCASVVGAARSVEAAFGAALDHVQRAHSHVVVQRRVDPGAPRSALLTAAAQGQLLVVGARGRGGLAAMALGSVSLTLLHHAPCPVTVVRPA